MRYVEIAATVPPAQVERPQRTGAQVVAIREATGNDQHVVIGQLPLAGQQLVGVGDRGADVVEHERVQGVGADVAFGAAPRFAAGEQDAFHAHRFLLVSKDKFSVCTWIWRIKRSSRNKLIFVPVLSIDTRASASEDLKS